MKKFGLIFCSLLMSMSYASDKSLSPVGEWQTIDDISGKPKAIIRISESAQGLSGQILKIFPSPGHDQNELCTACEGDKHNQPIVGMVILEELTQDQKNHQQWVNGHILDPKTGKVYKSMIELMENGEALKVRGYIGLPLFGRSQTWIRLNSNYL